MSLLPSAATLSHHLEKLTSATDASMMDKSHITSFILAFQNMEEPGAVLRALRHRLAATWASQAMVAQLRTLTVTARWLDFLSALTNDAPNEVVWQSICGEVARHESEPAFRVLVGEIQARMATLAATWWGGRCGCCSWRGRRRWRARGGRGKAREPFGRGTWASNRAHFWASAAHREGARIAGRSHSRNGNRVTKHFKHARGGAVIPTVLFVIVTAVVISVTIGHTINTPSRCNVQSL